MSIPSDALRQRIVDAAMTLFARYGFQRTGMADIAREAGVSRQSLYSRFPGKPEVFTAMATALKDRALAAAAAAWDDTARLEANLAAVVLAAELPLYRLLRASPHGASLFAVDAALTAAIAQELDRRFKELLVRRLRALDKSGKVELGAFGGAVEFVQTMTMAAIGLKHESPSEAVYVDAVHRLCRIAAHAVAAGKPRPVVRQRRRRRARQ
jgi:AcrR family transcriptional regulator